MIQESFNINQRTIHEIMDTMRTIEGGLNVFSLMRDRHIFLELMSQLEKNTAKQLQALMKKFIEERNETLESQLILSRNTWRTVEVIKAELEEKVYPQRGRISQEMEEDHPFLKLFVGLETQVELILEFESFLLIEEMVTIIHTTEEIVLGTVGDFNF
jgi:hypothetical protein